MSVILKEKKLKNGAKRYYLVIWHKGKRNYEFLHRVEKSDDKKSLRELAEKIRAQRTIEIASDGYDYIPKHKRNITIAQYLDNYIKKYQKRDIRTIKGAINKFYQFLQNTNLPISNLNQLHLEGYIDYLVCDSGLNGDTPYTYWRRFKKILIYASKEGYIKESIYKYVRWDSKNKKAEATLTKQVLTEEEILLLKNTKCGNSEIKRAFLFACYTGLGYAEFKVLTWKNIVNEKLIIDRAKTKVQINNKLSKSAIKLLGDRSKELIFNLKIKDKFISDTAINKNLKNWIKKAGIEKDITFYCGRHTFAVRLLANGVNLKTVSDALGHKSSAHTIKYLNHVNNIKDEATSNLI